ncbi:MAG: PEP/pyruvate-binding domain-containing protein [Phycisphaerae bacterium]
MPDDAAIPEAQLRALQERAKELRCLYRIEELSSDPGLPLERVLEGAVDAIPPGWQFPERCRARIVCGELERATPGFAPTPWTQRATIVTQGEAIGAIEVCYASAPPPGEPAFLPEEQKLLETIAERIATCVAQRRLISALTEWHAMQHELHPPPDHHWSVILDLVRRTDRELHQRITRKMVNHLAWSGVPAADDFLERLRAPGEPPAEGALLDSNAPLETTGGTLAAETFADDVFRLAAAHLSDDEIVNCLHGWMREDRARFLLDTVEDPRTGQAEVVEALGAYLRAARGETPLAPATLTALRVTLLRRFVTSQAEYIRVAKNVVDLRDLHTMMQRSLFPAKGDGQLGGKAAGVFLAEQILRRRSDAARAATVRVPRTWYLTSDVLPAFVRENHLEDAFTHKYKPIDEIRLEYPDMVRVFKRSRFPVDVQRGLSAVLDEFCDRPLIVRSSSLLEDRFGAAFSGKYKSLFLANRGPKPTRLAALLDAIAEVYASIFGPDPIEYRTERGLLDSPEGMAILIQEVVGRTVGPYYLPVFAGVAFSNNEFRWSPRIRREDGLLRMVPGLGTRAVDRLGDDYPVLASPGQPALRTNVTTAELVRYAPRYADVINLDKARFESVAIDDLLRVCGDALPQVEQIVSLLDHDQLREPLRGQIDFARDALVVTFAGLLRDGRFAAQIQELLATLQQELRAPVDIEFAHDGDDLYLVQCRTQNVSHAHAPAPIPRDVPPERVIFTARRFVSNGSVPDLTHVVYVDPERFARLPRFDDLVAVGRCVGRLNQRLPKRRFALIGPGRWGSRGDPKLGVRVTYADINNTALLIEVARARGGYTPDLSFGTHFFQDLVESEIRYLPLYPDDPGVSFHEAFFAQAANVLAEVAPEFGRLADVVRVIDVPRETHGLVLRVLLNADLEEALGMLAAPSAERETILREPPAAEEPRAWQYWRWRRRMAERIAARLDPQRFGVVALYLFGSTEAGTAGPASDIDLLVHFRGTPEQRRDLEQWLDGWNHSLSEVNYLRTGYRTRGLLDVHILTDDDLAARGPFASRIGAITDAAQPLALGGDVADPDTGGEQP